MSFNFKIKKLKQVDQESKISCNNTKPRVIPSRKCK